MLVLAVDAARHSLRPERVDGARRHFRAAPVETEERHREITIELRTVGGHAASNAIEHVHRQTARIRVGFQHDRRHRADQHGLRDPLRPVTANVTRDLAAARRMADQRGIAHVERVEQCREIVGIRVHVVAGERLSRPAVTAPVVRDHAVAVLHEEQHLCVPCVGVQRPAVREHDRAADAPVLVEIRVPSCVVMVVMVIPLEW